MRIYLDKTKEEIMSEIKVHLDKVRHRDGWSSYTDSTLETEWTNLQMEFTSHSYCDDDKKLEILERCTGLMSAIRNKKDVIGAFQVLLDNMHPDTVIDDELLKDDNK